MIVNIRNILIAVLVLGFFGLLYAFLSSKPVMVSDSRLRVEEPPLRPFNSSLDAANEDESGLEVAATPLSGSSDGQSDIADDAPLVLEEVLEKGAPQLVELPETVVIVDSASEDLIDPTSNEVAADQDVSVPDEVVVEQDIPVSDEVITEQVAVESVVQPVVESSTTDVALIANGDDFINLNLVEETPVEMVLLEGDELIMDDVNEELSQFQLVVEANSVKPEPVQSETDSPLVVADEALDEEVVEPEQVVVSTIVIPDVDQALMTGTDKVSLEYQETMEKLLNVKQQMVEADAENERLKAKFSAVVNQNRELAILIRDIDVKIKSLTAAN